MFDVYFFNLSESEYVVVQKTPMSSSADDIIKKFPIKLRQRKMLRGKKGSVRDIHMPQELMNTLGLARGDRVNVAKLPDCDIAKGSFQLQIAFDEVDFLTTSKNDVGSKELKIIVLIF